MFYRVGAECTGHSAACRIMLARAIDGVICVCTVFVSCLRTCPRWWCVMWFGDPGVVLGAGDLLSIYI